MIWCLVTFVVQNLFQAPGPAIFELYYPVAFILASLSRHGWVLLERNLTHESLLRRPLETLLANLGVSLVLIQLIRSILNVMLNGILSAVADLFDWK